MLFKRQEENLIVLFNRTEERDISIVDNAKPEEGYVSVSSEALNNHSRGATLAPDMYTSGSLLWEERTISFQDLDTGTTKEVKLELDRKNGVWTLTSFSNGEEHTIKLEQSVIDVAKGKSKREDLNLAALFLAFKASGLFRSVKPASKDGDLLRSCYTYTNGNN